MQAVCPHCATRAITRTSLQINKTMRHGVAECSNIECGFRFQFALEVLYGLNTSNKPDPEVTVPLSEKVRETMVKELQRLPVHKD